LVITKGNARLGIVRPAPACSVLIAQTRVRWPL
jgi:hypothetical protein